MAFHKTYFKAKWDMDGNFPEGLSKKQAYVWVGMLVGWLIENNLLDEDFIREKDVNKSIQLFRNKELTGPEFFAQEMDGVLSRYELSKEGNFFIASYFDIYQDDFEKLLASKLASAYLVEDNWDNYNIIKQKVSQRYAAWKLNRED